MANVAALIDLKADINARDAAQRSVLDWCTAAADSDDMPDWYTDVYSAFETPAAFEYDDSGRLANAQTIKSLLEEEAGSS